MAEPRVLFRDEGSFSSSLEKGSLVTISGLKSESGQKLNGGLGIVLSDKSINANGTRYPVLIFALKNKISDELHRCPHLQNQIKVDNLIAKANTTDRKLLNEVLIELIEGSRMRGDQEKLVFWYEITYKHYPDNISSSVNYASLLRGTDPRKALEIMRAIKESLPASHQFYHVFCHNYCEVCCCAATEKSLASVDAAQILEEALKITVKIPTDSVQPGLGNMVLHAFREIIAACNKLHAAKLYLVDQLDPRICGIQMSVAETVVELDMHFHANNKAANLFSLGWAYCSSGDNMEGAKCYRQALKYHDAHSQVAPDPPLKFDRGETITNLLLTQLQCPGMPLENYTVLGYDGNELTYVKTEDRHKITLYYSKVSASGGRDRLGIKVKEDEEAKRYLMRYGLHAGTDPDDPKLFPASLLEKLNSA